MAIELRQSTASQNVPIGYFVDSTDGNTEKTALSLANTDILVHKANATTLANPAAGATHISNGIYYAVLGSSSTDTLGPLVVFVHKTGALPVRAECVVLRPADYDFKYGLKTLFVGSVIAGSTTTTLKMGTGASATDDYYKDGTIIITGGIGRGTHRRVTSYDGTNKAATVDTWLGTTPDTTSRWKWIP